MPDAAGRSRRWSQLAPRGGFWLGAAAGCRRPGGSRAGRSGRCTFGGLAGVLDAGQLDDDPALAGPGQGRLGDPERVDPAAQHLQRAVGGLGVGLDAGGVPGLQHDLGAAPQVEAEPGGQGERGPQGEADDEQGGDGPPEWGAAGAAGAAGA